MRGKDWSGNSRATFSCLAASTHSDKERVNHDYYATDPLAIDGLKTVFDIPEVVCEPCCGEGHLSKRLEELGHRVYSSDLIDRGYGEVRDFFAMTGLPRNCNCILTNPPYKYLNEVIIHAMELLSEGGILALFVKLQALEGLKRYGEIYSSMPPYAVFPFVGRVVCAPNGDFEKMNNIGSAVAYCWMVWRKGFNGNPIIKWINYNRKNK